ncbi:MAG: putative lipid II flippase FtsW [Patescibacteria group bacterium]
MNRRDLLLLGPVVFLTIFGLLMIYDASSFVAYRDFSDKYHYVKDQFLWIVLGFLALFVGSRFDYKRYYNLALPLLLASILFLFLVFIPGIGISALGASRWINMGFFILQPSELVKLSLAIYLAAWFSSKEKGRLPAFLLLLFLIVGLIMLQPDMGTASIVLAEALAVYFLSGANILHILGLIPVILLGGLALIKLEPYRAARLSTFLNPDTSLQTTSYHTRQILIALGSGGLTGLGFGNSLQKYAYLPEGTTDSIFAIIAEETGFVGALLIILIFAVVIWSGFKIAMSARDTFGKLLAGAIITFLGTQIIINLSAQTLLLPLTGIPLPFLSYGGSALIVNLFSIGILLNISKQRT